MAIRLKTKWHKKEKERTVEEVASALAFSIWRIGMEGVLHLENEDFETETNSQRMDIAAVFVIFLTHVVDRMAYDRLTDEERAALVTALAKRLAIFMQENREEVEGPGDYTTTFIQKLNEQIGDYAECSWSKEDGPGFSMRRTFGDHVTQVMGERYRKWVTTFIIDIEAPEALRTLNRTVKSLLDWEFQ
ncbi:MAG TPA: hypothetical protein ENJ35_09800 [Gammaproteobacteria bacterium]|nr:hypothetical protein [Gammaproteobacteria bacterium]